MTKRKRTNTDLKKKTLHRKLKIEQHEPHLKSRVSSGAPEGLVVPVLLAAPVLLL